MFSATKLLGGIMENGLGGGGMLGTAAKVAGVAAAGGVAYGAYRHYKAGGFGQGGPGLFGKGGEGPPPAEAASGNPFGGGGAPAANPFGGGAPQPGPGGNPFGDGGGAAPGGNPWANPTVAQPPVAEGATPTAAQESEAMLLVRAMIAAAYVDGNLDAQERNNIMKAASNAGMGDAEQRALEHELANPKRPNVLLGQVQNPELAKQVYLVTLLAIDRDSPVEQAYVAGLPIYLGLTPADVGAINQQLGF